jgi:tryptophan synthase alpha chain
VTSATRSLQSVFAELRIRQQIGLLPFIPAGYPDLDTTRAILPVLEIAGASAIEIGIPFSDPIADGPTIQEAFTTALSHKLKVKDILTAIACVRPALNLPLIAMISYSIVYRYGLERFLIDAAAAGFDGLILPDLPPPEARLVCDKVRAAGLDTILLVSPTTAPQRRQEVARLCSGFVYYLAVSGITGERDRLPADLEQNLRALRSMTQLPVCVGFGISKPEHVAQLAGLADGAIVGSALVRRIKEHQGDGPAGIAKAVELYCRQLLSKVR